LVFARTSVLAIGIAFAACEGRPPKRYVQHAPTLAALRLRVPDGACTAYDVVLDRWLVATARDVAIIDVPPAGAVASPDALRHVLEVERRTTATVESRETLSDGFATTILVHAAPAERVTLVVRQLGNKWVRCAGAPVLCRSIRRG
jgi:hypothetical protein